MTKLNPILLLLAVGLLFGTSSAKPHMNGIDTHIHLYEPVGLDWLKPSNTNLNQSHHTTDFKQQCEGTLINRAVVVEAGTVMEHTEWMLDHTRDEPAIAAVIGNLDLRLEETAEELRRFSMDWKFRGIRVRGWGALDYANPVVRNNLAVMNELKLVLETGMAGNPADALLGVAHDFPNITIIINHMADGRLNADTEPQAWWGDAVAALGSCDQVYCKLSMFDAVFKKDYAPERLDALFNPILEAFGPDRLLYGSNWPVSPEYKTMLGILTDQVGEDPGLLRKILIENPTKAYRIQSTEE
jgi:L-fuconolactonase